LGKDETKEYTITFRPDLRSRGSLRGYFVEIEVDLLWTMPNSYPPRLTVDGEGSLSITGVWWTTSKGTVTQVQKGELVQAHVRVKASGGDISGSIKIRIRRDIPSLPDVDHKTQTYTI
jgi:hypothetical protein